MNTPYVKQYDDNGNVTNPITEKIETQFANRKSRREILQGKPLHGCGKNTPLTVLKTAKFLRRRQVITQKDGSLKTIEHYLSC